jgi:alpha-D-ribose 1-methylphosphonate 5-triphosphate synthase subunit PhnL
MELHRLPHHIGDLVKTAVLHIEQGLENPALHRFQAVVNIGNGPLADDIGGVLKEILLEELLKSAVL